MILAIEILTLIFIIMIIFYIALKHIQVFKNLSKKIYLISSLVLLILMLYNAYLLFFSTDEINFSEEYIKLIHDNYKYIIYISCIIGTTLTANIVSLKQNS